MTRPRQFPLHFPAIPQHGRDAFLVAGSNRAALAAIGDWRTWPGGRLALTGPPGTGKSHLAAIWAGETGGTVLTAAALAQASLGRLMETPGIAIDGADCVSALGDDRSRAEETLFHLINHAANAGRPLLLTGREGPARWPVVTPDLASRLAASATVPLGMPTDALLSSVVVKLFDDRQLQAGPDVIEYVVRRIARDVRDAERAVTRIDRHALASRRKVTVALVREVMGNLDPMDWEES